MIDLHRLKKSFTHAFAGFDHALRTEQNFRIMFGLVLVSLVLILVKPMAGWEKVALVIAGALMLGAELLNTALERAMNVVLPASLEEIKDLKDMAAAAALVVSVGWVITVLIVLF
ncbi:MAG: diacylglycerol kinase [Patescibacteria group bacterium]